MMLSHLLKLVCFFLATFPTLSLAWRTWYYSEATRWVCTFPSCGASNQSPIDIDTTKLTKDDKKAVTLSGWDEVRSYLRHTIRKDEHTTWYRSDDMPARMTLDGNTYQLSAIYYHWGSDSSKGSEHKVDGQSYAGEAEMAFFNSAYSDSFSAKTHDDGRAILSFFLNEDPKLTVDRPILEAYRKILLKLANQKEVELLDTSNKFSLGEFLPDDLSAYRYKGILPYPPCNVNVEWVIVKKPIEVTTAFMKALRALNKIDGSSLGDNFRPVQLLGSRKVYDVTPNKVSR